MVCGIQKIKNNGRYIFASNISLDDIFIFIFLYLHILLIIFLIHFKEHIILYCCKWGKHAKFSNRTTIYLLCCCWAVVHLSPPDSNTFSVRCNKNYLRSRSSISFCFSNNLFFHRNSILISDNKKQIATPIIPKIGTNIHIIRNFYSL